MPSKHFNRAAVAALTLGSNAVDAFWRLECPGSIGLARIDPLMDYDGVSGHVHDLKGGSGTFTPSKHFLIRRQSRYRNLWGCGMQDQSATGY